MEVERDKSTVRELPSIFFVVTLISLFFPNKPKGGGGPDHFSA